MIITGINYSARGFSGEKQWIVGTALLMLMTGNVWADGESPTENILKDQFKKQYHGILKLDAITLKNLDAKGNQAIWSAEGDVSSSDDLYTWVGQLADYELLEQTWTKDKPVKFSAMLTSKGTPASGWSVNFTLSGGSQRSWAGGRRYQNE